MGTRHAAACDINTIPARRPLGEASILRRAGIGRSAFPFVPLPVRDRSPMTRLPGPAPGPRVDLLRFPWPPTPRSTCSLPRRRGSSAGFIATMLRSDFRPPHVNRVTGWQQRLHHAVQHGAETDGPRATTAVVAARGRLRTASLTRQVLLSSCHATRHGEDLLRKTGHEFRHAEDGRHLG
jgi:hypothetical protein